MINFVKEFIRGLYFGLTKTTYLVYFYSKKLYISSLLIAIPIVFISSFGIRILPTDDIASMNNTYHGNELVVYVRIYDDYDLIKPKDIVILESHLEGIDMIKRVIAMPNDAVEIKNGTVFVNNIELDESGYKIPYLGEDMEKITLSSNQYFVLGDNRPESYDSRSFGPIKKIEIKSKVIFTALPKFENVPK